ncbi:hypothetical protein C5167_041644 [Papaver somniferum]|nr:hypothetical protein C5167_041644 [Papaver somniferum]
MDTLRRSIDFVVCDSGGGIGTHKQPQHDHISSIKTEPYQFTRTWIRNKDIPAYSPYFDKVLFDMNGKGIACKRRKLSAWSLSLDMLVENLTTNVEDTPVLKVVHTFRDDSVPSLAAHNDMVQFLNAAKTHRKDLIAKGSTTRLILFV